MPTSDSLRSSVDSLLSDFASRLEALVNQAALERVMTALGGDAPAPARRGRPKGSGRKPGRPAGSSARGGKRSTEEVDAMAERLVAYVKSNPGQGLEGIAAGLGTSTKELKLPVIKLLASRQIKKTGQKRGTKYFAGGRSPGRPAKAKTAKRGKKKAKGARKGKRATKARRAKGRRKTTRATKAKVVRRRRATNPTSPAPVVQAA